MTPTQKYLILYYNRVTGSSVSRLDQIPYEPLKFLGSLDYLDLIKPFVIEDLERGSSRDQIAIKYGVSEDFGRGVGETIGRFKKRKRRKEVKVGSLRR